MRNAGRDLQQGMSKGTDCCGKAKLLQACSVRDALRAGLKLSPQHGVR